MYNLKWLWSCLLRILTFDRRTDCNVHPSHNYIPETAGCVDVWHDSFMCVRATYCITHTHAQLLAPHKLPRTPFLLQHTATHGNALQRTATHCNALQHTATHCNTLQHTATHCNTLQRTATHCNTLQHTATHCIALQHTAHTATHWFIHTWHDPFKTTLLQLHQTLSHTYTYTHIHTHTHINTYYKYITWTQLCTKETYIRTKEAHIKRHDFIYVQKRPI